MCVDVRADERQLDAGLEGQHTLLVLEQYDRLERRFVGELLVGRRIDLRNAVLGGVEVGLCQITNGGTLGMVRPEGGGVGQMSLG